MEQEERHNESLTDPKAACRDFDAELGAYLEGEGRPEVLTHARECMYCRVVLGDLQQVISTSAHLGDADPPARLWSNVRATLVSEGLFGDEPAWWQQLRAALGFLHRPAPVAALASLALLGFIVVAPSQTFK